MANALPKNIQAKVKRAVYKKADEFGYMECGRIESGRFLDTLVDDPEVGKVIIEYMPKERVRTYQSGHQESSCRVHARECNQKCFQ